MSGGHGKVGRAGHRGGGSTVLYGLGDEAWGGIALWFPVLEQIGAAGDVWDICTVLKTI